MHGEVPCHFRMVTFPSALFRSILLCSAPFRSVPASAPSTLFVYPISTNKCSRCQSSKIQTSVQQSGDSEITSVLDDCELESLLNFDLPLESTVQSQCFPTTHQTTGQSAHSTIHPAVIAGPPQQQPLQQERPQQEPPQQPPQQQPPQQERPQQERPQQQPPQQERPQQ